MWVKAVVLCWSVLHWFVAGLKECLVMKWLLWTCMHMSCHLRECILDYGPINHFWLFAFESFKGILGQLPTNNRSVEVQMIKWFLYCDTEVMRIPIPSEFREDFESLSFHRGPVETLGTGLYAPHQYQRTISHSYGVVLVSNNIQQINPQIVLIQQIDMQIVLIQ